MAKLNADIIQQVLDGLTDEQLNKALQQKRAATLEPLISEWEKIDGEQDDRITKILAADPDWRPSTLGDKIVSWMTDEDKPKTKDEIQKQFIGKNVGLALSKVVKKNRLTLTGDKYSVTK